MLSMTRNVEERERRKKQKKERALNARSEIN